MSLQPQKIISKVSSFLKKVLFRDVRSKTSDVSQIYSKQQNNFEPEKQEKLEQLCAELFKRRELITSGKFQLIGLAQIKKKMGKRWENLCQLVYDVTEEVLRENISQGDIFVRYQDDTYVIIFARASLQEGQVTAMRIAHEIRKRLFELEEDELKNIEIRENTQEFSKGFLGNKTLSDFLNVFAGGTEEESEQSFIEQENKQETGRSSAKINISTMEVHATELRPLNPLLEKNSVSTVNIDYSYLPLWDTKRNALTTFLCLGRGSNLSDDIFSDHERVFQGQSFENSAALDRKIFTNVLTELMYMKKDGRKFLIACPVHYETLQNFASYEIYKQLLKQIPASHRQYLIFYITDAGAGLQSKDAYWFGTPLHQFCRHIFAEMPLRRDINFNYLRNKGIDFAGIRLDSAMVSESSVMSPLTGFVAKAQALQLEGTFILGVKTLSLATSATCAGFDFLGGPAIQDEIVKPDAVRKYGHEDLVSRNL